MESRFPDYGEIGGTTLLNYPAKQQHHFEPCLYDWRHRFSPSGKNVANRNAIQVYNRLSPNVLYPDREVNTVLGIYGILHPHRQYLVGCFQHKLARMNQLHGLDGDLLR